MRLALILPVFLLGGCSLLGSVVNDRSEGYLTAEPIADTQVPEGMAPLATQPAYSIPALPVKPERPTSFEVPRPAPLLEESTNDSASLAQYQAADVNPRLDRDGAGTLILRLDIGYAQSWAEVTEALAASDLKLLDLNRSTGTYFLEIVPPADAQEQGFWASLFGPDEPEPQVYWLKMNRAHSGVYLSLLTESDALAEADLTESVLTEILRQLES
ncbi:hypothetical protein GCM10011297_15690 [Bacterioplanes sanyensis]|uniref:outer membrane protein assembly factor BamC n=1 Tax=Bacterioplanes sanyensis TaxID=1249553 RepID=UPI00167859B2|nr:outer membrane protein assembly factor BamC [Bacterioplanes sanyensis]GGY43693.1 hypothetical protein GCM10011297_15690 [Bacterioplanes sanyensis]